jgi:hypothetical protein
MRFTTFTGRLLAVALTAAGLAVTASASPAAAADSTWVRGIDGVLYPGCHSYPFKYAIEDDKASYDWSLEVTVFDERGVEVGGAWLWKDEGDPASGTAKGDDGFQLCDSDRAGEYTIEAELNFYGGPYTDEQFDGAPFRMRDARSRTKIVSVSDTNPVKGQRLTVRVRSTVEYPKGFFGSEYEKVVMQKKIGGKWKRSKADYTNNQGIVVFRGTWPYKNPVKLRAVTPRTDEYSSSTSKVVTVR